MQSIVGNQTVARVVATIAIVGHLLALLLYVLAPGLVAPARVVYGFAAAWVIVLALAVFWYRRHPWRSTVVVAVGAVLAQLVRVYGEQSLGWEP